MASFFLVLGYRRGIARVSPETREFDLNDPE